MSNRHAELQALKQEIFESLHCALPGFVESFDSETQTAVIRPALKARSGAELPLLRDVPVFLPESWHVSAGDRCLVVFSDADIDAWLASGEVSVPASARQHSLSDGFAFVGFQRAGRQIVNNLLTGTGEPGQAGSSSAAYIPSRWIFDLGRTPADGDIITIRIPAAGVNAGVYLSADSGETFLPVALNGATRLTTQYAENHTVSLVYQTGMATTVYPLEGGPAASSVESDRWCVLNYYDSNTTYTNAGLGQGYGICDTAAATVTKEVTLSSYALTTGGFVAVRFTNDVPANAKMSVNGKTAKYIYHKNAKIRAGVISAGDLAVFVYSTYYHLVSII